MNLQHSRYINLPDPPPVEPYRSEAGDYSDDLAELRTALPSQVASEIDHNYFKSSSKEAYRSAVQRASAVYRNDFLRYRPLEGSVEISSPSVESRISSSAASRDSVIAKANKGIFLIGDLRQSAIRRKALQKVVQSVINVKFRQSILRYFPWSTSLEEICSYFGRAAASYFSLVRFLFILNIFLTFIVFFFLVIPYLFLSNAPNIPITDSFDCIQRMKQLDWIMCNDTYLALFLQCSRDFRNILSESLKNSTWVSHGTNILRGQGYLTLSPLYYAYYTDIISSRDGTDIFPGGLLYFCVIGFGFFVSTVALLILSYMAVIENGPDQSEDFHYHFASVAFAGWDHITSTKFSCDMRQATLRRFVKAELERVLRKIETEKLSGLTVARLWAVRFFLMLVSLAVIVGGVIVILISSSCGQIELEATGDSAESWFTSFAADYLPPIVVVLLNAFQPDVFVWIAKFENYAPETEVKIILFRLILSRFATVVTFMVPLLGFQLKDVCPFKLSRVTRPANMTSGDDFSCAAVKLEQTMGQKSYCWEANIGEQLFKIVISDFVSTIILTFAYSLVRRVLVEKLGRLEKFRFLKKLGRREFELPVEVINLFYLQTITWMGMYFMPLLPMFAALTRFALFYMKRFDIFENTFLTWRVRAADFVQSFYMAYLCACFITALAFTGYASSVMMASPGCGPFAMANNNSALSTVFDELKAVSQSAGRASDILGHPLVAGSFVTVVCFVAICSHLYVLSAKRRVKAIRQLIDAERHIRDYYFGQISSTRNSVAPAAMTNSRIISTLQSADGPRGYVVRPQAIQRGRYIQNPRSRALANLPSAYGPDLAVGSGIYDLRRQMSRF